MGASLRAMTERYTLTGLFNPLITVEIVGSPGLLRVCVLEYVEILRDILEGPDVFTDA